MSEMISLLKFGGEIPRVEPHLLPDHAAQQAINCDFSHNRLAPLKAGFQLATMSNVVKTLYTEDGINFYTWPTETSAVKSPVMDDLYGRVYFLEAGVLRVTTTAGMLPNGGAPASSYKAGVPRPTVAPTLALVDRTDFRDYPGATIAVTAWWEYNGKRYQEEAQSLTTIDDLRKYTFTVVVRDTVGTPEDAVVRATFEARDSSGKPFMTATITAGQTDVISSALPGNVTFSLISIAGLEHQLELTYGVVETRAYTYTARNTWLEESPPSPPAEISPTYLQDVSVLLAAADFSGGYRPLDVYRTYRTMGTSPAYLCVHSDDELSYVDASSKASDVLGSLETLNYASPPALLDVLVRMPNGCLVGFKGTTLYLAEAYRPHSWQYQLGFSKNIRGLAVAPGGLLVTTADGAYAVMGVHPSAMQATPLPVPQAGISHRAMTQGDNEAAFLSHDGIVAVVGAQANLVQSQALFTRDDWRGRYSAALDDGTLHLAHHDGMLVATSTAHALGFVLRTDESVAGQLSQLNVRMDSKFQLPATDSLYYSVGTDVFQFRGGDPYTYTWWSKDFVFRTPRNLGAGRIKVTGTVTMSVYADGELWRTRTFTNFDGNFRLKSGRSKERWSVKLTGTGVVEKLQLARTLSELNRA